MISAPGVRRFEIGAAAFCVGALVLDELQDGIARGLGIVLAGVWLPDIKTVAAVDRPYVGVGVFDLVIGFVPAACFDIGVDAPD